MKLIVGLGNPGKNYAKTRHNAGWLLIDHFHDYLKEAGVSPWELSRKFNGFTAGVTLSQEKVLLLKPTTFMNESGHSVQLMGAFYKIRPQDIIVLHDEIDIPLGEIKVQTDRGHAGHNGVRSIIDAIGTKQFTRVRIGIGTSASEQKKIDTPQFVLQKFGLLERRNLQKVLDQGVIALTKLIRS